MILLQTNDIINSNIKLELTYCSIYCRFEEYVKNIYFYTSICSDCWFCSDTVKKAENHNHFYLRFKVYI